MADDFSKYERKEDDFSAYERPGPVSKGWTLTPEPGSQTEALIRGFTNAATLGFGDEAQAALRALVKDKGEPESYADRYRMLRDQERAANVSAEQLNPGTYLTGNVAGALPQALNIAKAGITGAKVASQFPKIGKYLAVPGGAAGAATAGGVQGAVQGAGAAETVKDIPAQAAEQAKTNAVVNAIAYPIAAGVGNLAKRVDMARTAQALARPVEASTPRAAAVTASVLRPDVTLPALGALGNMGRVNMGDSSPDWSTDPYSAAGETALAGLQGAAAGYAVNKGGQAGAKIAEYGKDFAREGYELVKPGVQSVIRRMPSPSMETLDSAYGISKTVAPFSLITDYLTQAKGATNPAVQEAAAQAQEAADNAEDPDAKRKAAMILQQTPEGRAVGNSASNVRDLE